ncbi:cutinase transcription factor 1 beta [Fusarium mundagurra]|uniref:Cutinase transcription factor 1 beta n=1 Tax=Fusarium mundagurra TaxID=1567541 RepID=A0A8H6D799_9HYPO|nr:cutinase transcription factor 1 beta [Fusarium mundagurra]
MYHLLNSDLDELEKRFSGSSAIEDWYLMAARLHLQAFYLFDHHAMEGYKNRIAALFSTADNLVDLSQRLNEGPEGFFDYCPFFCYQTYVNAAFVLLKILTNGFFNNIIDANAGKQRLESSITGLRQMSVVNNDLPARLGDIIGFFCALPDPATMYDADCEKNKVILIQSVFLMGHFYADAEDRLGPWHWNGIAMSISPTIVLHMLTSPSRNGIRPLWRRIWWCIYYREVWLSMDQAILLSTNTSRKGLPGPSLKETRMRFEPTGSMTGTMTRVQYWRLIHINTGFTLSMVPSVIVSHWLNSFRKAAIMALYRPFLHETLDGVPGDEQDSWKALAKSTLRTAAAHATHAINCMMAEDLIKFAQTITVLAINLALCLLALDEMRKYYVSVDAPYRLFDRARIMVEKSLRNDEIVSQGSAPAADCPREPQGVETSEGLDESASMGY